MNNFNININVFYKDVVDFINSNYENQQSFCLDFKKYCKPIGINQNKFFILVRNDDFLDILKNIDLQKINKFCTDKFNDKLEVEFIANSEYENVITKQKEQDFKLSITWNKNLTFENYIQSESNKIAVNLFLKIINTNEVTFNPIILYGSTGLGKTHLVSAFANKMLNTYPDKKIKYLETQEFLKLIYNAINSSEKLEYIKEEFSNYDILILEDIQFLTDKKKSNEIFFTIFNNLINKNHLVILTSDKQIEELEGFEERMISRFSSGVNIKFDFPNEWVLKQILTSKLEEVSIRLTPDAIEFIVSYYYKDIRKLLGVINNISLYSLTKNDNYLFDKKEIEQILNIPRSAKINNRFELNINPQTIINAVAKVFNVKAMDIIGLSRKQEFSKARHMAMYILRNQIGMSFEEIGSFLSNRNHSTIISGVNKFSIYLKNDPNLQLVLDEIIKKI